MQVTFRKLFDVEIYHHYYRSKISQDFVIAPTPSCNVLLKNYGLLFRLASKGFIVLYPAVDSGNNTWQPLKPIEENVRFSFTLQSKNPYVINYSDLPLTQPAGHIYYVHNTSDNIQNSQLLLSAGTATEFLSSQDLLELRRQRFAYRFQTPNSSAEIELRDRKANVIVQATVHKIEGGFRYPVDVRRYGAGSYTLNIDGVDNLRFYASDELIGKRLFGLIDIFRDDEVPAPYRFIDPSQNHQVLARTYVLKLNNRKTYWKYYVVLNYRLKGKTPDEWPAGWPDAWSIVYPPNPAVRITPKPQEVKMLGDGVLAVPFVAADELPLQQDPVPGIQLKKTSPNGNNGGMRELENLPNPSVASVVPDATDGNVYSEMFVYV